MRFLSLRALFLLGFVIAMPVLALPPVARRIDELLYGPPPGDFGRAPALEPRAAEPVQSLAAGQVSPARFDDISPAAAMRSGHSDNEFSPPPLAATPDFAPVSSLRGLPPGRSPEQKIDEPTIARLQQIRQRLEHLGAEYVVVETQEAGRFRFHCRMLIDERSRFTRPFEAISLDAVAAGERVLRDVETWRLAASGAQPAAAQ